MPVNVDIVEILEKLSQLGLVRLNRLIGDWYSVYCPFHNDGNEHRASCGVSVTDVYRNGQEYPKGVWHCFTCNCYYNFVDGITKILESKNISMSGLEWLEENIPGFNAEDIEFNYLIPPETMNQLNNNYAMKYVDQLKDAEPEYITEEELSSYRFTVPYMYERGLTDDIIEKYDIGVDMKFIPQGKTKAVPCITFPVRDEQGRVLFIARRAIDKKQFYLPIGIDKPIYGLYELPDRCKSVDIVESVFNLTNCVKYGRPAIALFGTGTVNQRKKLRTLGIQEFRLGLDPDDAGQAGTRKLKKALKDIGVVWQYDIPTGKDINDLTEKEFKELALI